MITLNTTDKKENDRSEKRRLKFLSVLVDVMETARVRGRSANQLAIEETDFLLH